MYVRLGLLINACTLCVYRYSLVSLEGSKDHVIVSSAFINHLEQITKSSATVIGEFSGSL